MQVKFDLKLSVFSLGLEIWPLSIVLNFYLQRPVFALKIRPRPKRPMKAKKSYQRPGPSKIIDFINIPCKIIH